MKVRHARLWQWRDCHAEKALWNGIAAPYHLEVHRLNDQKTVLAFTTEA